MPLLAPTVGLYPSIEDIFNATRVHLNDTFAGATSTVGEGRIFTDSWTPSITILNLALQVLQRDLESYGMPTTREELFVISASKVLTLTAAANASGGNTVYTGTITGGANNGLINQFFTVTGFTNPANNIASAVCVASTATTITLANPSGITETHAGTATAGGISPVNGPLGLGIPDPAMQVYLSFLGYFDGSILHPAPALPTDLLVPLKVKQRMSGSGSVFTEIAQARNGLYSANQNYLLGEWEWRQDRIYFNGSQNTMDIEIRYTGGCPRYATSLNPNQFSTTLIPFLDSGDALSYKCAYIFASPRLPKGGAEELDANYRDAMLKIANRWIRVRQRAPFQRTGFGSDGGPGASGTGWETGGN